MLFLVPTDSADPIMVPSARIARTWKVAHPLALRLTEGAVLFVINAGVSMMVTTVHLLPLRVSAAVGSLYPLMLRLFATAKNGRLITIMHCGQQLQKGVLLRDVMFVAQVAIVPTTATNVVGTYVTYAFQDPSLSDLLS